MHGAAKEYGLKVDERLYFGKTVLKLDENTLAVPITFREVKFSRIADKDIRCAKFVDYIYVGTVVLLYDPISNFDNVLSKRVGNLHGITLICGNETKIRYFDDNDIIEDVKQLKELNSIILKKATRYLKQQKGEIVLYGKLTHWEQIFPMRYIHWWHGDSSAVRVYIINVSLRTGVGTDCIFHV